MLLLCPDLNRPGGRTFARNWHYLEDLTEESMQELLHSDDRHQTRPVGGERHQTRPVGGERHQTRPVGGEGASTVQTSITAEAAREDYIERAEQIDHTKEFTEEKRDAPEVYHELEIPKRDFLMPGT